MSPGDPRRRETGGGERPIDLVHLTRQTFGDKRLETELLRLFVRQARQIQAGLDAEAGADAVSGLPAADLLHTLIGSARVVGAHRVAALAQDCEAALRSSGKEAPSERERAALRAAVEDACGYVADLVDAA